VTDDFDFDFDFDDLRPRSWLDAFPWLKGAAESATPWWNEPIDDADVVARRQRLAQISELAMERLTMWTIGQIFPGLSPDLQLAQLHLPARAVNALGRHECGFQRVAGRLLVIGRVGDASWEHDFCHLWNLSVWRRPG
jgi:hypothetical protein